MIGRAASCLVRSQFTSRKIIDNLRAAVFLLLLWLSGCRVEPRTSSHTVVFGGGGPARIKEEATTPSSRIIVILYRWAPEPAIVKQHAAPHTHAHSHTHTARPPPSSHGSEHPYMNNPIRWGPSVQNIKTTFMKIETNKTHATPCSPRSEG